MDLTYTVRGTVSNGNGKVATADVTNVAVACADDIAVSILDWNWATPTPQANHILDTATDGAQVVLVGDFGTVRTSIEFV